MAITRAVLTVLMVAIVTATGCGLGSKPAGQAYSTISAQELLAEVKSGEKEVIVDLREPALYRAGHVPGAKNIPFEEFQGRLNELSQDDKIVLVCHTGPMGDLSGGLLAERGYTKVSNLKGGMAAWSGDLEK